MKKDKMHAGFFNQTAATKYSMIDIKVNICCSSAVKHNSIQMYLTGLGHQGARTDGNGF